MMDGEERSLQARLRVLASGSGGNCSVLLIERPDVWGWSDRPTHEPAATDAEPAEPDGTPVTGARVCLIDLGLSPRRTFTLLREIGIRPDQVDDVLLTHFDSDHLHRGWLRPDGGAFAPNTRVHVHRNHARLGRKWGLLASDGLPGGLARAGVEYDDRFDLHPGVSVDPIVMDHDDQGVVAFRFDFELATDGGSGTGPAPELKGSLGFATDLGRLRPELVQHLTGVNVLAIESNYCPQRQQWSGRPEVLKRRIMGGNGHLSNEEALEAITRIGPVEHVVLLHLSRDCNCPDHVRSLHDGADYAVTITSQFEPTRWVRVAPALCPTRMKRRLRAEQTFLWAEPKAAPTTPRTLSVAGRQEHPG